MTEGGLPAFPGWLAQMWLPRAWPQESRDQLGSGPPALAAAVAVWSPGPLRTQVSQKAATAHPPSGTQTSSCPDPGRGPPSLQTAQCRPQSPTVVSVAEILRGHHGIGSDALVSALSGCVTSGKLFNLSEPLLFHLYSEDSNNSLLVGFLL